MHNPTAFIVLLSLPFLNSAHVYADTLNDRVADKNAIYRIWHNNSPDYYTETQYNKFSPVIQAVKNQYPTAELNELRELIYYISKYCNNTNNEEKNECIQKLLNGHLGKFTNSEITTSDDEKAELSTEKNQSAFPTIKEALFQRFPIIRQDNRPEFRPELDENKTTALLQYIATECNQHVDDKQKTCIQNIVDGDLGDFLEFALYSPF